MKKIFTKMMSVVLLFAALFMTASCSKDDNTAGNLSTQTADNLIALFIEMGVLTQEGVLVDDTESIYIAVDSESDAIVDLEDIVAGSFDTSGEKVILADGSSYVNIVKSSTDGVFYNVTFSLNELDLFEVIFALEEYCNNDNWKW